MRRALMLFGGLVVLDQLVKAYFLSFAPEDLLYNRGVLFGWISNPFLVVILVAVGLILLFYIAKREEGSWAAGPNVLILAGAISNLVDRVWRGGVIDYIKISEVQTANLADLMLLAGVIWCALLLVKPRP